MTTEAVRYVAIIAGQPIAVSSSLETVQAAAEESASWNSGETRWDEEPRQNGRTEWTLRSRDTGRGRWSKTGYSVWSTPDLDA